KTSDEATKSLCRTAPEATNQATSKRRGDVVDLRWGSITKSTQTRSYSRRITDGSLAGHHNPDPDASQSTASRGLVSPHSGPRFDKSAHRVNAPRARAAWALPGPALQPCLTSSPDRSVDTSALRPAPAGDARPAGRAFSWRLALIA